MVSGYYKNMIADTSRGVQKLYIQMAQLQRIYYWFRLFTSFDSDGVTTELNWDGLNHNGGKIMFWGWRANGGTTSSNKMEI